MDFLADLDLFCIIVIRKSSFGLVTFGPGQKPQGSLHSGWNPLGEIRMKFWIFGSFCFVRIQLCIKSVSIYFLRPKMLENNFKSQKQCLEKVCFPYIKGKVKP